MKTKYFIFIFILFINFNSNLIIINGEHLESSIKKNISFDHNNVEHSPISINGDQDLSNQANIEGWKGSGTASDPYIIENYEILTETSAEAGIFIGLTTVFLKIVNNKIIILAGQSTGILLESVKNVYLFNNTFENLLTVGIQVFNSINIEISQNSLINSGISAILIQNSDFVNILNNKITNSTDLNIGVYDSSNCNVIRNLIEFEQWTVEEGRAVDGIVIQSSSAMIIDSNVILNGGGTGIMIINTQASVISNNTVMTYGIGIKVFNSDNNLFFNNKLNHISWAIHIYNSTENLIGGNQIFGNTIGINFNSGDKNVITYNLISENTEGLEITQDCRDNLIYYNGFKLNTYQVILSGENFNSWDNGITGNYWSDHSNQDRDNNGIADEIYTVWNSQVFDYYPLVDLTIPEEFEVQNILYEKFINFSANWNNIDNRLPTTSTQGKELFSILLAGGIVIGIVGLIAGIAYSIRITKKPRNSYYSNTNISPSKRSAEEVNYNNYPIEERPILTKNCPDCNAKIELGDLFCSYCGIRILK